MTSGGEEPIFPWCSESPDWSASQALAVFSGFVEVKQDSENTRTGPDGQLCGVSSLWCLGGQPLLDN